MTRSNSSGGVRPSVLTLPGTVLDFLKEAGDPDLHEFVQIISGDGEEFHSLQQRVAPVLGFLQDAVIERHPLQVAVEIKLWIIKA